MAKNYFFWRNINFIGGLLCCLLSILLTFNVQSSNQQSYQNSNRISITNPPPRRQPMGDDRGYNIYDYTTLPANKLAYNTSFAVTVPLFSFTLPRKETPLLDPNLGYFEGIFSQINPLNQIVYGLIAFGLTGLITVVARFFLEKDGPQPTIYNKPDGYYRSLNSNSPFGSFGNMIIDSVINSENDLGFKGTDNSFINLIGLNWKKCMQKSICKANHSPKQFGILSVPFQVMFKSSPTSKWANSTVTSFKSPFSQSYINAAKYGKRVSAKCSERFKCFIDFFDMAEYLIAFVKHKFGSNEV